MPGPAKGLQTSITVPGVAYLKRHSALEPGAVLERRSRSKETNSNPLQSLRMGKEEQGARRVSSPHQSPEDCCPKKVAVLVGAKGLVGEACRQTQSQAVPGHATLSARAQDERKYGCSEVHTINMNVLRGMCVIVPGNRGQTRLGWIPPLQPPPSPLPAYCEGMDECIKFLGSESEEPGVSLGDSGWEGKALGIIGSWSSHSHRWPWWPLYHTWFREAGRGFFCPPEMYPLCWH